MHHCLDCSKWYHTTCLEKWTEEVPPLESSGGKIPPQLAKLAKFPIARGGWWGIGGNINVVAKARSIVASGDFDKWEDELALAGLEEWEEVSRLLENADAQLNCDSLSLQWNAPNGVRKTTLTPRSSTLATSAQSVRLGSEDTAAVLGLCVYDYLHLRGCDVMV